MSEKKTATLVLGGGSALGLAHIGVLSVLENEYDIKAVLGTSMGAIVGGLYAMGLNSAQILQIANRHSNAKALSPLHLDRFLRGIFDGRMVLKLFHEWTYSSRIEDAKIPFIACSYDLNSKRSILFNKGFFADAMRASSSLPLIFSPFSFHDYLLVDGGTAHPLPISYAHLFKNDLLIAVNVLPEVELEARMVEFHPVSKERPRFSFRTEVVLRTVFQNQAFMAVKDITHYEPDIVIQAAMPGGRPFAFHRANAFYDYGRKIALKTLEEYREPSFLEKIRKQYRSIINNSGSIKL